MDIDINDILDFIINNDNVVFEQYYAIKKNIETNFYNGLTNYYNNNNIYDNNRFIKDIPKWHLNKLLEIEKNIILKKYVFFKY